MLGILASLLTHLPNNEEETALCVEHSDTERTWYILKGDFREQYEKAFDDGLDACLRVYRDNIQHRSGWSTDELVVH